MDKRIARAVAAAAVVTLPVLAGCGTGRAESGGTATATAPSSQVTAPGTEVVNATPSPTPSADPAKQTTRVQAATEKFVRTVLTIGYPDKSFDDYTDRIEPLMTKDGFDSLESADSIKKGSTALKSLYPQRARSAPKFADDPEVVSIDATTATVTLAYENLAQQKAGDDWKTLKSLGTGSVTVKLVLDDGRWLVDNAS
ncbi:hypothetical protein [Microlunatus antarcticus]|uniref:Mce-associated membrane protein n=1 Tax=Microlunatus antarcticus TaxID=53388 RepID=A0A7W5JSV6_9ACTN|nr:hypothetical protein [Microlunatus antarcticus]MBB3325704.1 hypothetical protein [Microlunatus antarcticus]